MAIPRKELCRQITSEYSAETADCICKQTKKKISLRLSTCVDKKKNIAF